MADKKLSIFLKILFGVETCTRLGFRISTGLFEGCKTITHLLDLITDRLRDIVFQLAMEALHQVSLYVEIPGILHQL